MRGLLERFRKEEGVTAVIVAISLIALFGAAVLAIDAGSVWRIRRDLIADTDSSAIWAGHILDTVEGACEEALPDSTGNSSQAGIEARTVYRANQENPTVTLENFEVTPHNGDCGSGAGRVRVDGKLNVPLAFAGIFGFDDVRAFSSSTAQYGPLVSISKLRPIGLCVENTHFQEWKDFQEGDEPDDTGPQHPAVSPNTLLPYPVNSWVHRILFTRTQTEQGQCGDSAGNWGWLDFNSTQPSDDPDCKDKGKAGGNAEAQCNLREGYNQQVWLDNPETPADETDCSPEVGGPGETACPPKSGAGGASFEKTLNEIKCPETSTVEQCQADGKTFPIVIYSNVTGSGATARYTHVAFLELALRGWNKITGQEGTANCDPQGADLSSCPFFDFEFVEDPQWEGAIGPDPTAGQVPTVHGVQLCGGNYSGIIDLRCDV